MKYFILFFAGSSMFAYSMTATSAERFRAHYEVNIDDGISVKTVKTTCYITSGTPVLSELAANKLSLTVDIGPADEYTLTVALTPVAAGSSADTPLISQSFNGRLAGPSNGPLEFQMQQNDLKIYGAITLSAINQ